MALITPATKTAVQNNFSKTSTLPVLSCGEFASDFRDSQGYTAFCTVQLNKNVILAAAQDPHKSLQPIRSSNSRSRLPRDQRSTTESTEIHGKENPNQLPLSVSFPGATPATVGWGRSVVTVCDDLSCRGNTHLACTSLGRASGVSRSGPDSVRAAPERSRRRAAGRSLIRARAFNSSSLMALVNRGASWGPFAATKRLAPGRHHALAGEPPRCSSDNGLVPGPIRRARP